MLPQQKWKTLTNKTSTSTVGEVIPAYEHCISSPSKELKENMEQCENFYWTSFHQYETYTELFPQIKNKNHCCGLGKTHATFQEKGIKVTPFFGPEEFNEQTR
jgi:hydroxymethylbilane synthase